MISKKASTQSAVLKQIAVFITTGLVLCASTFAADAQKPNIVFVLADDLGYGDLACYGHPYARTPALDQLAREGTMFKQFHVTGVTCCPSRTGFMTSKFPATYHAYPAGAGFGDRVTVTELLKQQGYRVGHFGKWHIGTNHTAGTYGIDTVISDGDEDAPKRRDDPRGRDAHIYDDAIKFMKSNKDGPFYMNVWSHMTHFPVDPPKAYADKFKELTVKESDFADSMHEKFEQLKKADGKIDEHVRNYLGEVLALDDSIARLLKAIDELGLRDNTIVVFSSDQGAAPVRLPPEAGGGKSAKNKKRTAGDKAELRLNMMGYSGGFRGGKHNMYEGGVRVPFIIRWPGHVPAGRVEEKSNVSAIDWLPTLCHIAGAKLPPIDFDGEDVSDIWLGKSRDRTKPLYWKTSNPRSDVGILDGQWKLISPNGKRGEVELFDLSKDSKESRNLASQRPDLVKTLTAKVQAWNATLPKDYLKFDTKDDK